MKSDIANARESFIQGVSRIANFWGLPKAMGAIYGVIYLSPAPITLDTMVEQVGVSKGAVSTNVRNLERLGMIHKHFKVGDRKDYYTAETDFWKIVKGILKEREKNEFNLALRTVGDSLEIIKKAKGSPSETELSQFYRERMKGMKSFFESLDSLVATVLALDELRIGTIKKLFGKATDK
jgi:DNA-binding transcriptional regulator GbsR (MarR family)